MGQIISELARRALTTPTLPHGQYPGGMAEAQSPFESQAEAEVWPSFPRRGGPPVTSETIERIQDEIDLEDATPWDHETDEPRKF